MRNANLGIVRSAAVAAAMYIYATGSFFEARMNVYMSDGLPVIPVGLQRLLDISEANASSTTGSLDLLHSSMAGIRLSALGEFKHIDHS